MTSYAYARVAADLPMPGVFEVGLEAPIGVVIEELLLIVECSTEEEWGNQVW